MRWSVHEAVTTDLSALEYGVGHVPFDSLSYVRGYYRNVGFARVAIHMPREMDHKGIRVIGLKHTSGLIRYLPPKYLVTTVVRTSTTLTADIANDLYSCDSGIA